MKALLHTKPRWLGGLILMGLLATLNLQAQQPFGQWDFNSSNLVATAGSDLTYADGVGGATEGFTTFGTTTSFGITNINGTNAIVMRYPGATNGMGFRIPTPPANGRGSYVDNYTLIMDVLYTAESDRRARPILETDSGFINGSLGTDLAISPNNGIGLTGGSFAGAIATNTWYRIAFVVQTNLLTTYINGLPVGTQTAQDDRLVLTPNFLTMFLAESLTGDAAPGYVNSVQFRDAALNTGQLKALGGPSADGIPLTIPPVPSYIEAQVPAANSPAEPPQPSVHIVLNQGDTVVSSSSIKLYFDGTLVPANVTATAPTFTIDYSVTNILRPLSPHGIDLVYSDSVLGIQTNSWLFNIANYQNVVLPSPIYSENFDALAEGTMPTGWVVTNHTAPQVSGLDLNNPKSDSYMDFVVIGRDRVPTVFTESDTYSSPGLGSATGNRRLVHPPIVLNGAMLDSLVSGNFAYGESDQRQNAGGQVQVMFTPDYNLTGRSNVFVAFKSTYEQNQDDIASVEYSIDQGQTWLPALYMLDDGTTDGDGSDVITNSSTGQIDVFATFGTPRGDQAYTLAYSNFIGAAVSTNLIPFISPRRNDDPIVSKRIEIIRLAQADNQAHVRLRFGQAGTSSWYFGIDDFGLYSINTPVITGQPLSETIDAGTPTTFTVVAIGSGPLTYQWEFNGHTIAGATDSSYTITNTLPSNAGLYDVIVANGDGPTLSGTARLTVVTTPQISSQPISQVADPGDAVTLSTGFRGGRPIGSYWVMSGSSVPNSSTNGVVNPLVFASASTNASGAYWLVVTNSYGAITSAVAQLTVFAGAITNNLVAHVTFDGNLNDSSGRGNNATYAFNGASADPTPTFIAGKIGQAFEFTTLADGSKFDYATFGYPTDLQFGETNSFSISLWLNYTNQSDDPPFISNKDWASSGNRGWGIFAQSAGDFRVNFTGPGGGSDKLDYHPTKVLRDGNWHNVVISFVRAAGSKAGYVYTYVDGVQVSQNVMVTAGTIDTLGLPFTNEQGSGGNPLPTSQTDWAVNIGQDGTGVYHDVGGAYNIGAHIDDVGIWRRALTTKEASAIFTAGQAGKDLSQAVVAAVLPPAITSDPQSQLVSPGADVTFSVTATGGAPLSYQWLKDGAALSGATSSALTLTGVSTANAGGYVAVVSNPASSITSHVAQLTIFAGPVIQDLVAHLKFDGNYTDSSGSGTDGSTVGTPVFEAGKIGQAVHVNSAGTPADNPSPNNYVTLAYPNQLKFGTNDFSIAFWAKVISQNDDKPFVSNKDWNSGGNLGWALASESDGMKWNFKDDLSSKRDSPHVALPLVDGTWHHLAVAFQRGVVGRVYLDGQLVNTASLTTDPGNPLGSPDTTLAVNIGQDGTGHYTDGGSGAALDAVIDDLGIWRRAITPQEASAVYSAGQAGKDLAQAVVGGGGNSLGSVSISMSGGNIQFSWSGATGVRLQKSTSLSAPNWNDVPGTDGANSYSEPATNNTAFYRLSKP